MLSNFIGAKGSVDVSVQVTLSAPENFTVTSISENSAELTWDKSPSSDYGHVDAYAVYYKAVTDVVYPLIPALTRYDILDSYTDTISGLDPSVSYDFIVYALTADSVKSSFDCTSCKDSLAATYTPSTEMVETTSVGGGYSSINIAQITTAARLAALRSDYSMHSSATTDYTFLSEETIEEISNWSEWTIVPVGLIFPHEETIEEISNWSEWIIFK